MAPVNDKDTIPLESDRGCRGPLQAVPTLCKPNRQLRCSLLNHFLPIRLWIHKNKLKRSHTYDTLNMLWYALKHNHHPLDLAHSCDDSVLLPEPLLKLVCSGHLQLVAGPAGSCFQLLCSFPDHMCYTDTLVACSFS